MVVNERAETRDQATARPTGPTCLDAALQYARGGWAVFPIKPRDKVPLTKHGCKDATRDVETIFRWWEQWPDANVGVATGSASSLLVVDLDGEEGRETWRDLCMTHGFPNELVARTGSGGWHVFYRCAEGAKNSAKKLGPGLDTRGDGGYVVAPPSLHPSGRRYEWVRMRSLCDAPKELLARLHERKREELDGPIATTPFRPVPPGTLTPYGKAALDNMRQRILEAPEGTRNNKLNEQAYLAGQLSAAGHFSLDVAADYLTSAALDAGLMARETRATFLSGFRAGLADGPRGPEPRGRASTAPSIRPPTLKWRNR